MTTPKPVQHGTPDRTPRTPDDKPGKAPNHEPGHQPNEPTRPGQGRQPDRRP